MYGNMPKDIWIAENTFSYIKNFIKSGDEVLDIGSGNGLVADLIKKRITGKINCIDVIDINKSGIPTTIYDGVHIPFDIERFDVVVCNFVLHHTVNQTGLIKEMMRVARSRVVILEDTPQNVIDRIFNLIHIFNSKRKYNSGKMKFRTDREWKELFTGMGIVMEKDVAISKDRDPLYPTNRRVYVLNKKVTA
jgi:ubiquinone/menaquinone biosynthesis C-methylase UbiE